jgi:hypothetical protein
LGGFLKKENIPKKSKVEKHRDFKQCFNAIKNIHHNKNGKNCKYSINNQIYKAIIRILNSGYDRRTKVLKARDFDNATKECLFQLKKPPALLVVMF